MNEFETAIKMPPHFIDYILKGKMPMPLDAVFNKAIGFLGIPFYLNKDEIDITQFRIACSVTYTPEEEELKHHFPFAYLRIDLRRSDREILSELKKLLRLLRDNPQGGVKRAEHFNFKEVSSLIKIYDLYKQGFKPKQIWKELAHAFTHIEANHYRVYLHRYIERVGQWLKYGFYNYEANIKRHRKTGKKSK
ncbi:MAG: hypothetical protein LWW94_09145 [Candidatus Desulfofervidaceae bacterium]|nr:hypothetical protein [Candidatus Desulfofervidaceae bacterium]